MARRPASLRFAVIAAAFMIVSACSYQKHFENSPSDYGSRTEAHENTGFRTYNTQLRAADHTNRALEYQQAISNEVDDLKGIRSSIVFTTDKNAYVAVILDNTATGTKGKGSIHFSDRTIASIGDNDRPNVFRPWPKGQVVDKKYSFDTIPSPHDLSSELVQAIVQKVRSVHPTITNVYVSANQQFINRFSEYANLYWRGESLQPYTADFNALVQQHFNDHGFIDTYMIP